jgi:hypothetical protein
MRAEAPHIHAYVVVYSPSVSDGKRQQNRSRMGNTLAGSLNAVLSPSGGRRFESA